MLLQKMLPAARVAHDAGVEPLASERLQRGTRTLRLDQNPGRSGYNDDGVRHGTDV